MREVVVWGSLESPGKHFIMRNARPTGSGKELVGLP